MMLSFRTRRFLRRLGISVLVLAVLATAALLCWLLWLNRYVIYTQDGAKLDFSLSPQLPQGEPVVTPPTAPSIPVIYEDDPPAPGVSGTELAQLKGFYVDFQTLYADPDAVRAQVEKLPAGTPVLLDVKSIRGVALYASTVVSHTAETNVDKVSSLITWMKDRYYLIARVPAFRDYWYGLNNVDHGLPKVGGRGSLWLDEDRCYWLNPASDGAMTYLVRITLELRNLGFREIVFSDFCFPNTDQIDFTGDKLATLNQAAAELVSNCATDTFAVSFQRSDTALTMPEGRTRLYLSGIPAADAAAYAGGANVADTAVQVVFLADSNDTRYDAFGVLRPLGEVF